MEKQGYNKTTSDHCVFVQRFFRDDLIILLLYVDDILIISKNAFRIDGLKKQLSESFVMKDLGPAKQILGVKITWHRHVRKFYDSQSAIHLGKNSTFPAQSKHIDVRYHWIRDILNEKQLKLEKVHKYDNGFDILTKSLSRGKIGVCCLIVKLANPSTWLGKGRFAELGFPLMERMTQICQTQRSLYDMSIFVFWCRLLWE